MRKTVIMSVVAALVVALGASLVFAAAPEQPRNLGPGMNYEQMQQIHQQMVDQHVKDGWLTQEQAQAMNEHMRGMGPMMNGGMTGSGLMMGGNRQ
jgi:membrane carboxypeptidase/penicillin-binding protein